MLLSAVQVSATVLAATPRTSLPFRLLPRIHRRKLVRYRRPGRPILTAFGRYSRESRRLVVFRQVFPQLLKVAGPQIVLQAACPELLNNHVADRFVFLIHAHAKFACFLLAKLIRPEGVTDIGEVNNAVGIVGSRIGRRSSYCLDAPDFEVAGLLVVEGLGCLPSGFPFIALETDQLATYHATPPAKILNFAGHFPAPIAARMWRPHKALERLRSGLYFCGVYAVVDWL
jgi:hypothetical protein